MKNDNKAGWGVVTLAANSYLVANKTDNASPKIK
jgi:hypothetical protein